MRRLLAAGVLLVVVAAILLLTRRNNAPAAPRPVAASHSEPDAAPVPRHAPAEELVEEDGEPAPFVSRRSGGASDDDEWTRKITVSVVSAKDRAPVADATVRLMRSDQTDEFRTGRTDAAGLVSLEAPERFVVLVKAPGFVTLKIDPPADLYVHRSPDRVDAALAAGRPLTGHIVQARSNTGIAGAEVYAWDATTQAEADFDLERFDDDESTGVRSDATGAFAFAAIPPDHDVVVAARAPGLATVSRRLAAGTSEPLVLELGGGASVSGFIRDADGKPIEGADVYAVDRGDDFLLGSPEVRDLHPAGLKLPPRAVSSANGSFHIEGLATPAAYIVTAARNRWDRGLADAVELLAAGAAAQRDVVVYGHCSIHGKLFGPDGNPVDFDDFTIRTNDGNLYHNPFANGSSSRGSTFSSTSVIPGEYVIEVRAEGPWPPVFVPVTVSKPGATEIEVRFRAGASISGVVTDETGTPLARISLLADGHVAESAADGTFRIDGVDAEPAWVFASDRSHRFVNAEVADVIPGGEPVKVVLSRGAEIIFSFEGEAPKQAYCFGRMRSGTISRWVSSDADGAFQFRQFEPEVPFDLTIHVTDELASVVFRELSVGAGKSIDLGRIARREPRVIRGRIVRPDGTPAAGANLTPIDRWSGKRVTADSDGDFVLGGAPYEPVLVEIEAEGLPRALHLLGDEAGRIRLEPGVTVTGRVIDARGGAASRAEVVVRPAGDAGPRIASPSWIATADSMGNFTMIVPAGRHALFVRTERYGRTGDGDETFKDVSVSEFEAALPGPVRVEARLR